MCSKLKGHKIEINISAITTVRLWKKVGMTISTLKQKSRVNIIDKSKIRIKFFKNINQLKKSI